MSVNQSTFGERVSTESVEDKTIDTVTPIVETVEVPPNTVVTDKGVVEEVKKDAVVDVEKKEVTSGNSTDFNIELENTKIDAKEEASKESITQIDWKEAIKKADPKEVAKLIGLSDFALEIDTHIKNGGAAADYLGAKAIDYSKISHKDLVMSDLKNRYPSMSEDKLQKLFDSEYKQSEFADEDEKEIGGIRLEADAEILRAKLIAEQSKFKLPETPKNNVEEQLQEKLKQIQLQNQAEYQKSVDYFNNNEATKRLLDSKRVTAKYGEDGVFNFNIDKPELLMKVITDGDVWSKVTSTKEGEPNVELLQEIALFALNPMKFKNDFVNLGKALGAKSLIDEGKNATRQSGNMPKDAHQENPVYKEGTYGNRKN